MTIRDLIEAARAIGFAAEDRHAYIRFESPDGEVAHYYLGVGDLMEADAMRVIDSLKAMIRPPDTAPRPARP